jgi:Trk K+ transport system NAD-binding subunit
MKDKMLIGGVWRDDDWQIAIGSTHIEAGDKAIGICGSQDLRDLERMFRR